MKILAITNTIEFQNRATFEAISKKYNCLDVLVKRNVKDYFKKRTTSDKLSIRYIHSLVPESWQQYELFKKIESVWLKFWLRNYVKHYDLFLFCNTHVAHIAPLLKKKKKLALFIDPYTLMSEGKSTDREKTWVNHTDAVLCTSKALASDYINKYLNIPEAITYYWPNTVDLSKWQLPEQKYKKNKTVVCGYSGNMNDLTIDLSLLDQVTQHFPHIIFRFAGNINFRDEQDSIRIRQLFERDNVCFLGFVPYDQIAEEVNSWDICLMFDPINETSRYIHHNKIYQYLALGKPVVGTLPHDDYHSLSSVIYQTETHNQFLLNLGKAINDLARKDLRAKRLRLAEDNSASARAEQFITIINTHYKKSHVHQKKHVNAA